MKSRDLRLPAKPKKKARYSKRARFWLSLMASVAQLAALIVVGVWMLPAAGIHVPWWLIALVGAAMAGWDAFTYVMGTRALDCEPVRELESMVGSKGTVVKGLRPEGMVRVRGELWSARSVEGDIHEGAEIEVVGQEGLKLKVKKDH